MNEQIICAILGILGVIAHSALKYKALKEKATAGNIKFSFAVYLSQDAVSIVLSLVAVGVWLFLFNEAAQKYPQVKEYTRTSFFAMGIVGSYLIQYFFSNADKKITAIIDSKTNALENSSVPRTHINSQS